MEAIKYPKGSKLFDSSYIIDEFISGVGATSQVYLVHRRNETDKQFAAKVIYRQEYYTDEYWKKFADEEVTSLRIMNQENLVQTYDSFNVNTKDVKAKVLIMEYVEGISLRDYINSHGCIIPKVALNIFSKILVGIRVLHNYKHTIIHRDLKPENIIISKDMSKVTILDFGIATVLQSAQDNLESRNIKCFTNEEAGAHGTFPYVIPDVATKVNGQTVATVQFDFYSLGVILYEMIMGVRPFDYDKLTFGENDNTKKITATKLRLPLTYDIYNISSNPTITPSIENMIFRCLACKKEDLQFRYNNIDELIADCNKAIASLQVKEDPTPLLKPVNKRRYPSFGRFDPEVVKNNLPWYKHWWACILAIIAGLAIIIVAIVVFFVLK